LAFEGLKEQLKDQWADLSSKIQENSTFNNLREKFEAQTPVVQKAIVTGAGVLFALFLFSFPWSYIDESQTHMTEFEDNRGLIQGLLHASRAAKEPSPLPPPMTAEQLRGRVEMVIKENRLIPDQIGDMQAMPDKPAKDLAPTVVIQTGLAVQLKKLNVDQIMTLSHQFHTMGPGIKLMGIDIVQSAGQSHYYDMIVRIVNFALPPMTAMEDAGEGGKKGKGSAKKPARKTEEETGE
jgi:hypothetical protein